MEGGQPEEAEQGGQDQEEEGQGQHQQQGGQGEEEKGTWVEGAGDEDNQRYRNFLAYCEERREETKRMMEGDEERKRESKRKREVWDLMRESMEFLRKNKEKWRERKLGETKMIKEEDKRDRLAVAKEKKKRYGIQGLSREETKRLKMRTEERLEIAKAKENYWKGGQVRGQGDEG